MPEYLTRERSLNRDYHTKSSFLLFEKGKIDPQNPEPIKVSITSEINPLKGDFSIDFIFWMDTGNFEDNSIPRPCITNFNLLDPFVAHDMQQPNSVFQQIKEKLDTMFRNTKYIQDQKSLTTNTIFTKGKGDSSCFNVNSFYVRRSLSELITALELSPKLIQQVEQSYLRYKALQPKNYNYEEIVKVLYHQVTKEYQTPEAVKKKINLLLFELNWPYDALVKHVKTSYDIVDAVASDLYRYFANEDKNEVFIALSQIDRHPPSMEKLEATFLRLYPEEKGLKEWLIKEMPDHRKLWLSYLPNVQEKALDLNYEEIADVIIQSYIKYKKAENQIKDTNTTIVFNRGDAYKEYAKIKKFKATHEEVETTIQVELEKLAYNAASVEKLLNAEHFVDKDLFQLLTEMKLDKKLAGYLPSVNQVTWVDTEYVEDVRYSKDEILERGKEFKETIKSGDTKSANGEVIRYENTGEYAYIVANGDNFIGIEKRFNINKEDLENVNYWDGFDKEGRYFIDEDKHWLHEGDIITLPSSYIPLNGELFYSYDRYHETGVKVKKKQGEFIKVPLTCASYDELKKQFLETLEKYDDNTRTFTLKFDVALELSAQVTAFFYIGLKVGGGIEMGSGDTRSFDVISQCFIEGNTGVGNKKIANAGVNAGVKQSTNPSMFNSLNGSYTSGKHFLAFFERSIYSYMKNNEWDNELENIGLGVSYWKAERHKKEGVWQELSKGYTQKVRSAYFAELGVEVDKMGSLKGGREWKYAESYSMKAVKTMDDLLITDDELNIEKKAKQEDETIIDYVELKIGKDLTVKTAFRDVVYSTNSNNIGEYLDVSLTIPKFDAKSQIEDIKDVINGVQSFKIEDQKQKDKFQKANEALKEQSTIKGDLENKRAPRKERREVVSKIKKAQKKLKQSTNARKKLRANVKSKFKELVLDKGSLKPKLKSESKIYGRIDLNYQKINGSYKLTHARITTGGKYGKKAEMKNGVFNVASSASVTMETEIYEYVSSSTINYTSSVYNGIFKEGIKNLDAQEKVIFDSFINEAVHEMKNKNLEATFSLFSSENLLKLNTFSESVVTHFKKDKLNNKTLKDVYQGYWKSDKQVFQSTMDSIKNDLTAKVNHQSAFSISSYSPEQLIIFECVKNHLFQEIDTLTHATTLSASQLFQNFGEKDPRFELLRNKILGNPKPNNQWTKFKDTRGLLFSRFQGKGTQIQDVAISFADKVSEAVKTYAGTDIQPKDAKWEECPIQDITPDQAQLYLGEIEHIVRYIQSQDTRQEFPLENVKGSDFMKGVLLNKNLKAYMYLLDDFEKDILFPLLLENIIYGKQAYN